MAAISLFRSTLKKVLPAPVQDMIRSTRSTLRGVVPRRVEGVIRARRHPGAPARMFVANRYLSGEGLEIGALDFPMRVPRHARVRYVDRFSIADLRRQYPELDATHIVEPDIIDDGETLKTIGDGTQDFVIASHILEHVEDPIRTLTHWTRVLKSGGILFLVLPDKRYTFDVERPVTTAEHLFRDHEEGPEWSRAQHFAEFAALAARRIPHIHALAEREKLDDQQLAARLISTDYSIHYHVWTPWELFELFLMLRKQNRLNANVELFLQNGEEFIFVLRKS